jgi:ABC-type bacteriocin/lantibiotic exporter with double-glycine peptidase domain
MKTTALVICLVGLGQWFFAYVYYAFWQHLAQNVSFDLRSRYLHAILRQEVSYFEKENVEQLPSQIGENF